MSDLVDSLVSPWKFYVATAKVPLIPWPANCSLGSIYHLGANHAQHQGLCCWFNLGLADVSETLGQCCCASTSFVACFAEACIDDRDRLVALSMKDRWVNRPPC